ncbi:MAG: HTH domain-containing protein [Prevotella sp.]|jgi:predicted DNA-binding transcriptional regulator YafY|nr:HTH domain-containing protein [Prevotella sp.]MBP9985454.1 HTH domain-containing protein [Prevotella sp.]
MFSINTMENLVRLHKLIRLQRTGKQQDLAQEMRMSLRGIQNYLNSLRELGAKINFDKARNTYYYENNFNIEFSIKIWVDD